MITDIDIAEQLRDLLGSEVDARSDDGCVRVLTPFEYPDGDGVVVRIERAADGRYKVSDGGAADATLAGKIASKTIRTPASEIARRFDAMFDSGQIVTMVDAEADVADACQRVANAAVSLAEATTYLRRRAPKETEFVDVIAGELQQRNIAVEAKRSLEGASGHPYMASLFVPNTETVIEPVGGERPWNVATSVYVEFGDLSKANGYRLMAVLDDREVDPGANVANLLGQVAEVASWQEHDAWISEIASR